MSALSLYETLSGISGNMVEAAAAGDWDRLIELERDVASLRSRLMSEDHSAPPLSAAERTRKIELIKRILAHDREVRSYTEPWMAHVSKFLGQPRAGGYAAAGR